MKSRVVGSTGVGVKQKADMPHLMSCPTDGKGYGALYTYKLYNTEGGLASGCTTILASFQQ